MAALDFPDAPTAGQVYDKWTWNGTQWVLTGGPGLAGQEILYAQITAPVSITNAIGAQQAVITPGLWPYDGSPILIEYSSPGHLCPALVNGQLMVNLWDANTDLGFFAQSINATASGNTTIPVRAARRLAPTAGDHQYNIRAWISGGTGTIQAGPGGASAFSPAFLRITRAT